MDDRYEEFSDDFPEHWFSYKGQFADTNRDLDHEERKHNAIIYIRAHFDQMMENSLYRYIYGIVSNGNGSWNIECIFTNTSGTKPSWKDY